jgi:hypothetical protein
MSSLAGYLRDLAERRVYDQDNIVATFESWENDHRYMIMAHTREKWISEAGKVDYVALKCAKRGNDVYVNRVTRRLEGIGRRIPYMELDFWGNPETNMIFVTLTYDTKLCGFAEAWKNIGVEWNRYLSNLRKQYGKLSVFRTWESFGNGHPHIHAIIFFDEYKFKVFPSYEKNRKGKTKLVWRIEEKRGMEKYWHSNQDVKAVYNVRGGLEYLKKYIMKCAEYDHSDRKGVKTLAMCWVFRKKAFYVSGQFRRALSDLIGLICSSQTRKVQVDLDGSALKPIEWKVLGFVSIDVIEVSAEVWTVLLEQHQINACWAEWEKHKQYD